MKIRRLRQYLTESHKLRAVREIRLFDLMRFALNGTADEAERFRSELQREIDPNAGMTVISLDDLDAYSQG